MDKRGSAKAGFFVASIVAVLLSVGLIDAIGPIWNGSGTSDDPYQVTNCTELQDMSDSLDSYFQLMNDVNCSDTVNWGSGAGFNPVSVFTGNFDGQNHTISSLFINRTGDDNVGLFGSSNGATIHNVSLTDVNVSGQNKVGGLVGNFYQSYLSIDNAYTTGVVRGQSQVGGLVGYIKQSTIGSSHSSVTVEGAGGQVGGLVGHNEETTISDSSASGTVNAGTNYAGGLVGYNLDGSIARSYATGNVTGSGDRVGGLVGTNLGYGGTAEIDDSYATGNVTGNNYVGGLVGHNYGYGNYATVDNSYATGVATGNNYVGGLVGGNTGYYGGYASIDNSYATGNASGSDNVGGLVGRSVSASIGDSFSTGSVTGDSNTGGLVGYADTNPFEGFWYNNTGGNAVWCIGQDTDAGDATDCEGTVGGDAGRVDTLSYFFNMSNEPMYFWNFPPWDTVCDGQGYASLAWEGLTSANQCMGYTAPLNDTTAPTWVQTPANQTVNYGQPFGYKVNATDDIAISAYSVNDTANFAINSSGYVTNNTLLDVGTYGLNITVNDTSGNKNSALVTVTVVLGTTQNVVANTSTNIDLTPVDANMTLYLAGNVTSIILFGQVTPNASGTTSTLTALKGVNITVDPGTEGNVTWVLIKIYYDASELSAANIDESTLRMYYYNATAGDWHLEPNQGVDTANDYVWANATHLSLFGLFGSAPSTPPTTGGGGGGRSRACTESWDCTGWSTCSGGTQTRTCVDRDGCGTRNYAPATQQDCVVTPRTPVTPAATCSDGIKNQGETGTDCGGPCKPCPECVTDNDCAQGRECKNGVCAQKPIVTPAPESPAPPTPQPPTPPAPKPTTLLPVVLVIASLVLVLIVGGIYGYRLYREKHSYY